MFKPALNFAATTAGETAKLSEAPDTMIPHTRKTGPTAAKSTPIPEIKHCGNPTASQTKNCRTAPTENKLRTIHIIIVTQHSIT